jgi:predicted nucleic acid-binding protein
LTRAIVLDSTCLIALERIERLDLLPALFESLLAPPAVVREFGTRPTWLRTQAPTNKNLVTMLRGELGEGESEAIALASDLGMSVLLDDRRARLLARRLALPIVGTVAVLVRARREGLLAAVAPVLEDLERNGFFMSQELKREALLLAGELI